ncbi:hypothetical protein ISCGN_030022 [Ixodes scapularis]
MLIMKILFLFALIKTTWGESFSEMCENVKLGALELEKENCMAPTYYKNSGRRSRACVFASAITPAGLIIINILAACDFPCPASAGVQATTPDPWELDLDLLHESRPGLLSEGAGDSVGLLPVGDGAVAARCPAVSSTGFMLTANCVVFPFAEETKDGGTLAAGVARVWRFFELRDMKPGLNKWASLCPESMGQAAASSLQGERLGRRDLVVGGQLCTPGSGTPEPYRKPLWAEEGEDHERQPGTFLREELIRALREAVGRKPPETFQGQRLWAIAGGAISGDGFLCPINDYIRDAPQGALVKAGV